VYGGGSEHLDYWGVMGAHSVGFGGGGGGGIAWELVGRSVNQVSRCEAVRY